MTDKEHSDGSSADYYKLPEGCTQLQDLISHRDMNAQIGEIFRAAYRYGRSTHSPCLREAKKIKFYIEAEIARLEKLEKMLSDPNVPEEAPLTHDSALEAIKIEGAKLFKPGFCGHGEADWRNCKYCNPDGVALNAERKET